MVARDGIEPPPAAFSGPLAMDLSGLESAGLIETKAGQARNPAGIALRCLLLWEGFARPCNFGFRSSSGDRLEIAEPPGTVLTISSILPLKNLSLNANRANTDKPLLLVWHRKTDKWPERKSSGGTKSAFDRNSLHK
jgi:hypothetical protein